MRTPSDTFDENPEARKEDLRRNILERFTGFRGLLDELPSYRLMPGHPNYDRYKCRMGFFVAVGNDIHSLIRHGVVTDPKLVAEGHPLEKTNPLGPEFTTQADINYVNRTLDTFLAALSR